MASSVETVDGASLWVRSEDARLLSLARRRLDQDTVEAILTGFPPAPVDPAPLVIDLSPVDYIDCFAFEALIKAFTDWSGDLVIVDQGGHVHRMLELERLDRAFPVFSSVEGALGGLLALEKDRAQRATRS